MPRCLFFALCLAFFPALQATSQEAQLQQLLKRFPDADANKDGKLTIEEAQSYRAKMQGSQANKPAQAKPTQANVAYGPHTRNVLDFYQAKSDTPTPLIVYIHGGLCRRG